MGTVEAMEDVGDCNNCLLGRKAIVLNLKNNIATYSSKTAVQGLNHNHEKQKKHVPSATVNKITVETTSKVCVHWTWIPI